MILGAFTLVHVLISLVGIASGLVVLYGFLVSKPSGRWTSWFLTTTIATSVTGFLFPFHHFMPSHAVGLLSLVMLGIAWAARRRLQAGGGWGRTFIVTSIVALYFNVFVLIAQLFQKVPALKALAPTQSEPPFQIVQLATLLFFASAAIWSAVRFHGSASLRAA